MKFPRCVASGPDAITAAPTWAKRHASSRTASDVPDPQGGIVSHRVADKLMASVAELLARFRQQPGGARSAHPDRYPLDKEARVALAEDLAGLVPLRPLCTGIPGEHGSVRIEPKDRIVPHRVGQNAKVSVGGSESISPAASAVCHEASSVALADAHARRTRSISAYQSRRKTSVPFGTTWRRGSQASMGEAGAGRVGIRSDESRHGSHAWSGRRASAGGSPGVTPGKSASAFTVAQT
jgi:hypothetical protein